MPIILCFFSLLILDSIQGQTTGPAKGTLVIVGGNDKDQVCFKEFVKLSGGKNTRIVVVTTASSSSEKYNYLNGPQIRAMREAMGLTRLTALHTHDRDIADTEEFIEPIKKADAVWFTGGRQWRLIDAYAGTHRGHETRA